MTAAAADTTIVDVLRRHARADPDRPYLTWLADGERVDAQVTFGFLAVRIDEVAASLAAHGVAAGDRVLLLYPQGPDFIVAFLACLASSVVAVPAYPPRNARHMPRINRILADAGAKAVLTIEDTRAKIEEWLDEQTGSRPQVLATDTMHGLEDASIGMPSGRDIAFLQYTSGSTGEPKGVIVTHDNILANLRMIQAAFGDDETAHVLSWLPAYHDMGLIGNLLTPLYRGGQLILMSPAAFLQKPVRWLQAVSAFRPRTTGAPNFAFDLTVRAVTDEQKAALDLSSLDLLYNGSEPIDAGALDRFTAAFAPCGFRATALYPCYGMAETTLLATGSRRGEGPRTLHVDADAMADGRGVPASTATRNRRTVVSCGWSAPGQTLAIVDGESRRRLEDGGVGEIWLSGPHIAEGYWRQEAQTQATFGARSADGVGPFLRTGDLGFVRDGELYVTGRRKDLIIIRGRNHYPHDIEFTVRDSHPALRGDGAVACAVEIDGEERLLIVHEIDRHHHGDADAAITAIRAAVVAEHEVAPFAVVLVRQSTVPKTSSGKKQRSACADAFQAGALAVVAEWRDGAELLAAPAPAADGQPRSREDIEAFLAMRVAANLAVSPDSLDLSEPFSAFGLDSLRAVTLMGEVEAWLGRSLSPTLLFNYPTIPALAAHLAEASVEHAGAEPLRG